MFKRPQKYKVGYEYWSSPSIIENNSKEYLDIHIRQKYFESLIENIRLFYNDDDEFTLHELGCGWCTNLNAIKNVFKNAKLSGNDIWHDALIYSKSLQELNILELDTLQFMMQKQNEGNKFDIIITNAHLIHLEDNVLVEVLSSLDKCTRIAILQENINDLETSTEMKLKAKKITKLPDAEFIYILGDK